MPKSKPRLIKHKYHRRRTGARRHNYHCSACDRELHKTARFCVECGAWFGKRKK